MEALRSWWEVPSIAHFCFVFKAAFNLFEFYIEEFEASLLAKDASEEGCFLQELIIRLLQGCYQEKIITSENWEGYLHELLEQHLVNEEGKQNPFPKGSRYLTLPLRTKVEIIHQLCHYRLDADDVAEVLKDLEGDDLRADSVGQDEHGNFYWYFYGTQLYKESPASFKDSTFNRGKFESKECRSLEEDKKHAKWKEKELRQKATQKTQCSIGPKKTRKLQNDIEIRRGWTLVCFTEDEWLKFACTIKKSRSFFTRKLHKRVIEDFLPIIGQLWSTKEQTAKRRIQELAPRRISSRIEKNRQVKEEEERLAAIAAEEEGKRKAKEAELQRQKAERNQRKKEATERAQRAAERMRLTEERATRAKLRELRSQDVSNGKINSKMCESGNCKMNSKSQEGSNCKLNSKLREHIIDAVQENKNCKPNFNLRERKTSNTNTSLRDKRVKRNVKPNGKMVEKMIEPLHSLQKNMVSMLKKQDPPLLKMLTSQGKIAPCQNALPKRVDMHDADNEEETEQHDDEGLNSLLSKVLTEMQHNGDAWPFLYPIDETSVPGYYAVVQEPMDLSTMENKVHDKAYKNKDEFIRDFELIVDNCELFNGTNSEVTVLARGLWKAFRRLLKQNFPENAGDGSAARKRKASTQDHILAGGMHEQNCRIEEKKVSRSKNVGRSRARRKKRPPGMKAIEALAQAAEQALRDAASSSFDESSLNSQSSSPREIREISIAFPDLKISATQSHPVSLLSKHSSSSDCSRSSSVGSVSRIQSAKEQEAAESSPSAQPCFDTCSANSSLSSSLSELTEPKQMEHRSFPFPSQQVNDDSRESDTPPPPVLDDCRMYVLKDKLERAKAECKESVQDMEPNQSYSSVSESQHPADEELSNETKSKWGLTESFPINHYFDNSAKQVENSLEKISQMVTDIFRKNFDMHSGMSGSVPLPELEHSSSSTSVVSVGGAASLVTVADILPPSPLTLQEPSLFGNSAVDSPKQLTQSQSDILNEESQILDHLLNVLPPLSSGKEDTTEQLVTEPVIGSHMPQNLQLVTLPSLSSSPTTTLLPNVENSHTPPFQEDNVLLDSGSTSSVSTCHADVTVTSMALNSLTHFSGANQFSGSCDRQILQPGKESFAASAPVSSDGSHLLHDQQHDPVPPPTADGVHSSASLSTTLNTEFSVIPPISVSFPVQTWTSQKHETLLSPGIQTSTSSPHMPASPQEQCYPSLLDSELHANSNSQVQTSQVASHDGPSPVSGSLTSRSSEVISVPGENCHETNSEEAEPLSSSIFPIHHVNCDIGLSPNDCRTKEVSSKDPIGTFLSQNVEKNLAPASRESWCERDVTCHKDSANHSAPMQMSSTFHPPQAHQSGVPAIASRLSSSSVPMKKRLYQAELSRTPSPSPSIATSYLNCHQESRQDRDHEPIGSGTGDYQDSVSQNRPPSAPRVSDHTSSHQTSNHETGGHHACGQQQNRHRAIAHQCGRQLVSHLASELQSCGPQDDRLPTRAQPERIQVQQNSVQISVSQDSRHQSHQVGRQCKSRHLGGHQAGYQNRRHQTSVSQDSSQASVNEDIIQPIPHQSERQLSGHQVTDQASSLQSRGHHVSRHQSYQVVSCQDGKQPGTYQNNRQPDGHQNSVQATGRHAGIYRDGKNQASISQIGRQSLGYQVTTDQAGSHQTRGYQAGGHHSSEHLSGSHQTSRQSTGYQVSAHQDVNKAVVCQNSRHQTSIHQAVKQVSDPLSSGHQACHLVRGHQASDHLSSWHQTDVRQDSTQMGILQSSMQQASIERDLRLQAIVQRDPRLQAIAQRDPRLQTRVHQDSKHLEVAHQDSRHQKVAHEESMSREVVHEASIPGEVVHEASIPREVAQQDSRHQLIVQQDRRHQMGAHQDSKHHSSPLQAGRHNSSVHQYSRHHSSPHKDSRHHSSTDQDNRHHASASHHNRHQACSKQDNNQVIIHQDNNQVVVHQDSRHLASAHQDSRHQASVHQNNRQQSVFHQEGMHLVSIHQNGKFQASTHKDSRLQGSVHQESKVRGSTHQDGRLQVSMHQDGRPQGSIPQMGNLRASMHQNDRLQVNVHQDSRLQANVHQDSRLQANVHQDSRLQANVHQDSRLQANVHQDSRLQANVHQDSRLQANVHQDSRLQVSVCQDGRSQGTVHQESKLRGSAHQDRKLHMSVHQDSRTQGSHSEEGRLQASIHHDSRHHIASQVSEQANGYPAVGQQSAHLAVTTTANSLYHNSHKPSNEIAPQTTVIHATAASNKGSVDTISLFPTSVSRHSVIMPVPPAELVHNTVSTIAGSQLHSTHPYSQYFPAALSHVSLQQGFPMAQLPSAVNTVQSSSALCSGLSDPGSCQQVSASVTNQQNAHLYSTSHAEAARVSLQSAYPGGCHSLLYSQAPSSLCIVPSSHITTESATSRHCVLPNGRAEQLKTMSELSTKPSAMVNPIVPPPSQPCPKLKGTPEVLRPPSPVTKMLIAYKDSHLSKQNKVLSPGSTESSQLPFAMPRTSNSDITGYSAVMHQLQSTIPVGGAQASYPQLFGYGQEQMVANQRLQNPESVMYARHLLNPAGGILTSALVSQHGLSLAGAQPYPSAEQYPIIGSSSVCQNMIPSGIQGVQNGEMITAGTHYLSAMHHTYPK